MGTPWLLVSLFNPSPSPSPRGQGGPGLECAACGASTNNYIQMGWEGRAGSDATWGLREGLPM